MLSVNRISTYNFNLLQQNSRNDLKQSNYYNHCCLHGHSISFNGKFGDLKNTMLNKYLTAKLKGVLQEFNLMGQNLDENSIAFKGDILGDKCKKLISYISEKTKTIFICPPPRTNFSEIERLMTEQGINLSSAEKTELLKRFNLSRTRQKLTDNIIAALEFFKHSKLLKSSSDIIQNTMDKMNRAIRCFGLSTKVKNIVVKAENDLGVKLDIPDSLGLAEDIYNWLARHKKAGHILPQEISFNDFDFFTTHNPALSSSYVSGIKPRDYDEIISKYPSLTNRFAKKQIFFNPVFLVLRQNKKDSASIFEDLEHELGHFWHNLEIGDEAFHSKRMNSINGFLSVEENAFLLDLKNRLSKKVCFIPYINAAGEIEEDFSKIIPDLQNMIDHRRDLEIEDILTEETISRFNQIIQNLEILTTVIYKNSPDCPEEVVYALTSPKELVAFAIQKRHGHKYDPTFLEILKKFGKPEIKD